MKKNNKIEQKYLSEWFPAEDESDFILNVRIYSKWSEEQFVRMINVANELLAELRTHEELHERWDNSFIFTLDLLINLMLHPGFLAENEMGLTKEDYKDYINERVEILRNLKENYILIKQNKKE